MSWWSTHRWDAVRSRNAVLSTYHFAIAALWAVNMFKSCTQRSANTPDDESTPRESRPDQKMNGRFCLYLAGQIRLVVGLWMRFFFLSCWWSTGHGLLDEVTVSVFPLMQFVILQFCVRHRHCVETGPWQEFLPGVHTDSAHAVAAAHGHGTLGPHAALSSTTRRSSVAVRLRASFRVEWKIHHLRADDPKLNCGFGEMRS